MTAVTAILLKHLTVKTKSGFEWLCLCPYHEDTTPSFSVNIRKKLFICYACGAKGNMAQLLQHLGVTATLEADEVSLDELSAKVKGVGEEVSRTERPPVGFPIPARAYSDLSSIHQYWNEKRQLGNSAIQAYKLGYDNLNDEAIIPVTDFNGHTVGMIRRTFDPSRPRYLYSKGMKTSEVVFGAHEAMKMMEKHRDKSGVLVITEGSVDAMSVYAQMMVSSQHGQSVYAGVAVLGSRISKTQAQIIKKMGFEEIIVATDTDRAGREASVQIQKTLQDMKCGSLISVATWPLDFGKDLNSILTIGGRASLFSVLSSARTTTLPSQQVQKPLNTNAVTTSASGSYTVKHTTLAGYERYIK